MTTTARPRRLCIYRGCENEAEGLYCDGCRQRDRMAAAEGAKLICDRLARTTSDDPAEAHVLEATRQAEGIRAMEATGWRIFRVGQYNAERTMDSGPSDTICFHEARRLFAFVEWKRPVGGVQSEDQAEFQRLCEVVGVPYVLASRVSDVENLHRERGNG